MLTRFARLTTILLATPAFAQTPAPPSNGVQQPPTVAVVMEACQADLKTVCGLEPFQMDRLTQCMGQNRDRLSPACQALWPEAPRADGEAVRSATRAMNRACAPEIQAHCLGTGGRARRECLRKNSGKLSEACRTAFGELNRARQARRAGANRQDED